MKLREILKAEKTNIRWGKWEDGPIPKGRFPMSRRRGSSYVLGSAWRWRLITFDALSASFRLLIAYRADREMYEARLGMVVHGGDTKHLASLEFHGSHGGWHALVTCDETDDVPDGALIGPWQIRLPGKGLSRYHRRTEYGVNEGNAVERAAKFFRLHHRPETLL